MMAVMVMIVVVMMVVMRMVIVVKVDDCGDDNGDGGDDDHTWAVDNSPSYTVAEDCQAEVACSAPDHHTDHQLVTISIVILIIRFLMTKNRLMVTIHSKDLTEILALYRMTKFDFPPYFLKGLMHSFPMM